MDKSFRDIKKDFSNGLGIKNSLFQTSISKSDWQSLQKFNSAIKVTNDGLTKSQRITKAWNENMTGCSMAAKRMGNDLITGKKKINDVSNAMNTASTSTKALEIAMNVFMNVGFMLAITAVTKVISELAQAQENAIQTAKEATESYEEEIDSINDYKEKLSELHEELNSGNLSYEETKDKRTELMKIQDELIEKFGTEKGAIESVTDAVKGQIDALDDLNEKAYRDWVAKADEQTFWNKLLPGGKSGLDQAIDYMESEQTVSFLDMQNANLSKDLQAIQKEIDETIRSKYNLSKTFAMFNVTGTPEEIKSQLESIRQDYLDLSKEAFLKNGISSDLWESYRAEAIDSINEVINKFDDGLEKHQQTYQTYIEGMIKYDSEYSDEYANILQKRAELETAENSGNEEDIKKARQAFMDAINKGIEESSSNENIKKYFESLYPELQSEFSSWNFEVAIDANTDGLTDITNDIGEKYTATDLLKMVDDDSAIIADSVFNSLIDKAIEYGICTDKSSEEVKKLIDLLVELGIVQDNVQGSTFDNEAVSFTETLSDIQNLSKGLDQLDSIMADVINGEEFDWSSILNNDSFKEAFGDCGEAYDDFIKTISESPDDLEKCQSAFDDLATAYINQSGVLKNLTEETKDATINMLSDMGIANAEEVVTSALNNYTQAQKLSTLAGIDLANATAEEIYSLVGLEEEFATAGESAYYYYLNKKLCSETSIDTSADCNALIALAKQCQVTGENLDLLIKLKNCYNVLESDVWGEPTKELAKKEAEKIKSQLSNLSVTANATVTPKFTGGSKTASAIENAAKDSKDTYSDWFDFMERRVEVLTDAFENLEKGIENVIGASSKNQLVNAQLGIVDEEVNNYTDALAMYKKQAENVLSTIDNAELREKIKNGAVELSQIEGDNADEVKNALQAYQNWSGKISECTQKLEELKAQIRELELQKFNNIVEDFTNQFDLYGDSIDLIKGQIGLLEEAGELIGRNYYTKQIEQSEKQLTVLESQKLAMIEQMTEAINANRVQKGTDEWLEMQNALTEVESSILDCKTSIEEFNNELLELNWQIFERVQTEFENLSSEMENLVGLFDDFNDIKVSDGKGTWTNEAIATLGLYAQQYELARYQVQQYSDALERLEQEYADGKYSATEYLDKLAELKEAQWDAVNSAESLEDAIVELNKTRVDEEIEVINDEISAYKELIDAQIELIEETENLRQKQEDLAEKSKTVADIEKQLAAMQNDNTASTVAKRKKLEEQLAEAKKDLSDAEHDYSIESQKDSLNKQYEDFEKLRNDEITALEESLKNTEKLISDSLEVVKQNANLVGQEIVIIAQEHGVQISDCLISAWANGENAIAEYGSVLSSKSSAFIANIMSVENEVYALQNKADTTSLSLSNMFSIRADNLVWQLTSSYVSEENLNEMTNVLQNSLINTLERGYDISSITSALNGIVSGVNAITSAAKEASSALENISADTVNKSSKKILNYGSGAGITGSKVLMSTYATGGIISDKDEGDLDDFTPLGEDHVVGVRNGEAIIPKEVVDNNPNIVRELLNGKDFSKYTTFEPVIYTRVDGATGDAVWDGIEKFITPNTLTPQLNLPYDLKRNETQNINIHYDKMFEFNGDFNNSEQLLGQMQKVAKNTTTKILDDINRDYKMRH